MTTETLKFNAIRYVETILGTEMVLDGESHGFVSLADYPLEHAKKVARIMRDAGRDVRILSRAKIVTRYAPASENDGYAVETVRQDEADAHIRLEPIVVRSEIGDGKWTIYELTETRIEKVAA